MTNHGGTEQRSSREDEHAIASIGLFDRLDARNPFVLKDLAAAMSGRLPAVMLVLCLLSVIAIVLRTAVGDQGSSIDTIYGQSLAERSTYSMIALSLSFVPFHVFVATVIEVRSRFADDLVLAGASAWQYVSGRLQFAFIALLLIASLFAPLFAAAHNLGGVSISNVLLGVGVSLVFGMPLSAAALLLAVHARFKVVGSLVPMLFLTGFWIAMALLTLGIFLAGVIQLIDPRRGAGRLGARDFLRDVHAVLRVLRHDGACDAFGRYDGILRHVLGAQDAQHGSHPGEVRRKRGPARSEGVE